MVHEAGIEPAIQIETQRSGFDLEKEEGRGGYAVFAALTETAETEWSRFLPTWYTGWDLNPHVLADTRV